MHGGNPFREGSAPELIRDGVNGFLVDDEDDMARAGGGPSSRATRVAHASRPPRGARLLT
jgi:hypothetical protein